MSEPVGTVADQGDASAAIKLLNRLAAAAFAALISLMVAVPDWYRASDPQGEPDHPLPGSSPGEVFGALNLFVVAAIAASLLIAALCLGVGGPRGRDLGRARLAAGGAAVVNLCGALAIVYRIIEVPNLPKHYPTDFAEFAHATWPAYLCLIGLAGSALLGINYARASSSRQPPQARAARGLDSTGSK